MDIRDIEGIDFESKGKDQKEVPQDQFKELVLDTFLQNRKLLIFLKDKYLNGPVAPPGCIEHWPYFREGQNELIRNFIFIIEEALHERLT